MRTNWSKNVIITWEGCRMLPEVVLGPELKESTVQVVELMDDTDQPKESSNEKNILEK